MKQLLILLALTLGFNTVQARYIPIIDEAKDAAKKIITTANEKIVQPTLETSAKITEVVPVARHIAPTIIRTGASLIDYGVKGSIETVEFVDGKITTVVEKAASVAYLGLQAAANGTAVITVAAVHTTGNVLTVTYHIAVEAGAGAVVISGKTVALTVLVSADAVDEAYQTATAGGQLAVELAAGAIITIASVETKAEVGVTVGYDLSLAAQGSASVTIGHLSVNADAGIAIN